MPCFKWYPLAGVWIFAWGSRWILGIFWEHVSSRQAKTGRQACRQICSHRQTELYRPNYTSSLSCITYMPRHTWNFLALLCICIWQDIALEVVLGVLHASQFRSRYLAKGIWMRGEVSLTLWLLRCSILIRFGISILFRKLWTVGSKSLWLLCGGVMCA